MPMSGHFSYAATGEAVWTEIDADTWTAEAWFVSSAPALVPLSGLWPTGQKGGRIGVRRAR
jgi:hypothetical protein